MNNIKENDTIVLVTGGFDPVHSGHIAYFKEAKKLGDHLIVGLNSDEWLERKKGRAFMPWNERLCIINNLSMVDEVYTFNDDDGSACAFIHQVRAHYPTNKLIFANGGDRTAKNIPEMDVGDTNCDFIFGVGGEDKKNSSSWILEEWKAPKTERSWGYYRVLYAVDHHTKVKELTVEPGGSLSMQRHRDRAEHWFVVEGTAEVYTVNDRTTDYELRGIYHKHQSLHITRGQWHQLCNPGNNSLKLVEIQYGARCDEEDIERKPRD
jgi:D-beta-D-heptose 7-phosphate kinase/D-beta-D-heptose 1-phosphate adenosyltransferase